MYVFFVVGLVVVGFGFILWFVKLVIMLMQDILQQLFVLWLNGMDWENFLIVWNDIYIDQYFFNMVIIVFGVWFVQLFIVMMVGYVFLVLCLIYVFIFNVLVLVMLFIFGIVLLVLLYLMIVWLLLLGDVSLFNNYFVVWLLMGVNVFNILLVKWFFDSLLCEVFEVVCMDGVGFFWLFWLIVLLMLKLIFGVVLVFVIIVVWKDYLWFMLVLFDFVVQLLLVWFFVV